MYTDEPDFFEEAQEPEGAAESPDDITKGLITPFPYLDAPEDWSPSWFVEDLIQVGGLNFIQGEPKAHKSMFRRYLLACIVMDQPVFGKFEIKRKLNKALVLLTEDHPGAERAIMDKIFDSYGVSREAGREKIMFAEPEFFNLLSAGHSHLTNLGRAIRKNDIDLLILDPLCNFHHAQENDSTEMARVNGTFHHLIKQYGTTIIVVHHNNKGAVRMDSRGKRIKQSVVNRGRGSSAIPAGANVIMDLENLNQSFGAWQLHQLETKAKGARDTDLAILIECLERGEETWLWRVAEDGELKKKKEASDVTVEDLEVSIGENHGLSREEHRALLGCSTAKLGRLMNELLDRKAVKVKRLGKKHGHYPT